MLRRIGRQACRRSQEGSEDGRQKDGLGFAGEGWRGGKGMHKKYHSMGESPLLVRKEILHKKEEESAIPAAK